MRFSPSSLERDVSGLKFSLRDLADDDEIKYRISIQNHKSTPRELKKIRLSALRGLQIQT